MITKEISIKSIIECLGDDIVTIKGNINNDVINNITNVERINEKSLDWIAKGKKDKQTIAELSLAKVLLVDKSLEYNDIIRHQNKIFLVVDNPKRSLIKILNKFFINHPEAGIDSSSYIHPEAVIGKNVYIGPNCFIGKCIIGDGNIIHSGVNIYDRTTIGNGNVIHSGAVICVDGLGCIRMPNGKLEEFPQIGGVIIGNNCYIGGNTHIASGSLSDTIIENGCKINGMSFIGSNDILHENVWITGSTMLAGSVEVGSDTTIFSRVVIRDWCKIGKKVTIGMGSVVTKNIPDGETWYGSPAKKIDR